ncbi:hypothetical protein D4R52_00420, partial [bacterium]
MNNFLIFFGLAIYALLIIFKREWGVYLIVLLLPAYQIRFQVGFLPMTFLEAMILILGAVEGANQLINRLSLPGSAPGGDEVIPTADLPQGDNPTGTRHCFASLAITAKQGS